MEFTASLGRRSARQGGRAQATRAQQREALAASRVEADEIETSTLVSIYRCDSELRVSEVIYSDHVADPKAYIGGTDYDWLPQEEAEGVMRIKERARREQRPARETLTLTWDGTPRSFRIAVFPEQEPDANHVVTVVVTEILDVDAWLRYMNLRTDAATSEPDMPRIGFVRMDNSTRTLLGPVRNVHLSATEWRLLRQLSSAHGGVVSHEALLSAIWGSGYSKAHHLLHDAVSRLRHRFHVAGVERPPIETVHGVGYRLHEDGEVF